MPVRSLPAELSAVRALVADGLAEIVGTAGDLDQFWIRTACSRLAEADAALAGAAAAPSGPAPALITTLVSFVAVAGGAAIARAAGWSTAGTLVTAGALLSAALWVTVALRRRRPPVAFTMPATAPGTTTGSGLVAVPEALLRARVRLVSAALRRVGSREWTTPALRRAIADDPVVARLADADMLLCQAVDCLERYLDDLAKGWP
ncbi:hypothetical protein [Actinoplanes sp. NPDC051851]|uniref:hypothetical protein n=1 Tax=Actinoplanes sp. NPDC051851 TaxID=3154753 RepID=UPI00342699F7